ncbi:MAG TPA: hypothetical protein VFB08_05585 [Burkholderiales bacterium]|nr:hypothetical protein [Burkholderiales bacterium]
MFGRKPSPDVEDFAISLARDFAKRCPPAEADRSTAAQVARAIDDTSGRAVAFQKENGLGMYGKAKFGTAFKLELKELGYGQDFIDALTHQLLLKMSAK